MGKDIKAKLLCIEDKLEWQKRIKEATNGRRAFHVDVVETYKQAAKARFDTYDVCSLDSRLEENRPRLLSLIKLIRGKSANGLPVLVVLTAYAEDVGPWARKNLFDVVRKSDVDANPIALKKAFLKALHESVNIQARDILKRVRHRPELKRDGSAVTQLEKLAPDVPPKLKQETRIVLEKYRLYRKKIDSIEEVLLDSYGYVSGIRGDGVEVVLTLPNGEEVKRIFDGDVCAAARVHFQDAPFRYTVIRKGSCISSIVRVGKPPKTYPGVVSMPEIDMSIFDEPGESKEG